MLDASSLVDRSWTFFAFKMAMVAASCSNVAKTSGRGGGGGSARFIHAASIKRQGRFLGVFLLCRYSAIAGGVTGRGGSACCHSRVAVSGFEDEVPGTGGGGATAFPIACELSDRLTVRPAWRWFHTYRRVFTELCFFSGPSTGIFASLLTERYLWSCRPLTSQISFCALC